MVELGVRCGRMSRPGSVLQGAVGEFGAELRSSKARAWGNPDHQDLAVALDDLGLDLSDFSLSRTHGAACRPESAANLRHALGHKRVRWCAASPSAAFLSGSSFSRGLSLHLG